VAQLSRPYQIALAAIAVLGLVWAVALHGHAPQHSESTGAVPSTPAPAGGAHAKAKAAAAPTPIYHGAAPGVEGLTRAIAKAHGAVATSQQNERRLQQKSREASQEASAGSSASAVHASSAQRAAATARAGEAAARARANATHPRHPALAPKRASGRPAAQVAVEREVAQGKTVMLLFWTPSSSVSREVRSQAQAMVSGSKGALTLHVAQPSQVGEFGSLTEVVHVYQTPTILIVNRHGVVSTLTGLTDTFALRQIVHEARRANR
jgi:hypothetical protein